MDDYAIFPLGDQGVTLSLGNTIDERIHHKLVAVKQKLLSDPVDGILDIVIAYSSITIRYDATRMRAHKGMLAFDCVKQKLLDAYQHAVEHPSADAKVWRIPVCYDASFGYDLNDISTLLNIPTEKIIDLHTSTLFRIYMVGFLPGFPYMAKLPQEICVPRKSSPRPVVPAGSVGLAGEQTGIYPVNSPGGWQIIGRTPMRMFDKNIKPPVQLQPGDQVQFYRISLADFGRDNAEIA